MPDPVVVEKNTVLPLAERLIVLVPEYRLEISSLGRYIRDLTQHRIHNILLFSAVKEPFASIQMAHVLGYLYAFIHDPFLHVETFIVAEQGWLAALKKVNKPGDIYLVLSDHRVKQWGFYQKSAADLLKNKLNARVFVLTVENGNRKNGHLPTT
jgi:hypothetical protein